MIRAPVTAVAAALLLTAGLGGCVSLFPKTPPVTLYKLDPTAAPAKAMPAASRPRIAVLRAPTAFSRVATGDRILTTTGSETADIAGARWAAPIQLMFDEGLTQAFDSATGVRLVTRGEPAPSDFTLRLEVRTYEARYLAGQKAAPTIVVEARGTLTNLAQKGAVSEKLFHAELLASDNRVGPIVDGFNGATGQLLGEVVSWTQEQTASAKPAVR